MPATISKNVLVAERHKRILKRKKVEARVGVGDALCICCWSEPLLWVRLPVFTGLLN